MLKRADANQDGALTEEEFGKAVIPLKFFQNENYALNYLDSIK